MNDMWRLNEMQMQRCISIGRSEVTGLGGLWKARCKAGVMKHRLELAADHTKPACTGWKWEVFRRSCSPVA